MEQWQSKFDSVVAKQQEEAAKDYGEEINQVRIGDGAIVNEKNIVIHSLGTLDWKIYDCIR